MYHNIEKSAFERGSYVGYGGGAAWRIRRTDGGWIAVPISGWMAHRPVRAPLLRDMSVKLAAVPVLPSA